MSGHSSDQADYNPDHIPVNPDGIPTPSSQRKGVTIGVAGKPSIGDGLFFVIAEDAREYDKASRDYLEKVRQDQWSAGQPQCDSIFVNAIIFDPKRRVLLVRPPSGSGCPVELDNFWTLPGDWCHGDSTRVMSVLVDTPPFFYVFHPSTPLWNPSPVTLPWFRSQPSRKREANRLLHRDLETERVCTCYFTETRVYQEVGVPRPTRTLVLSFIVEVAHHVVDLVTENYDHYMWATEQQVRTERTETDNFQLVSDTMRQYLPQAFAWVDTSRNESS
ncbi:hypothetical protein F5X99DRAFT_364253 [Biscogniauxia marginata]|nr:hypothetical protein F5X99DRAFT_364253 [Biscogniauxia marginata]